MKEHFQDYGVRKWAGDDLIELQSESLQALQGLVEPYSPCIIKGCETTPLGGDNYQVTAGLVALSGKDAAGDDGVKIARLPEIASTTLPIYLTLKHEVFERVYSDGKSKAIAYDYTAEWATVKPTAGSYLEITENGGKQLVDTIGITKKLDRIGGKAQDTVVDFVETSTRIPLPTGSKLGTLISLIKKWLTDLKTLAFKDKVAESDLETTLATKLNNKVDKVSGKQLSTNDFTTALNDKLNGIAAGAEVNVQADWNDTNTASDAFIKNKPVDATTTKSGLMSAADKTKLNGIATGAEVNVQADWNDTNTSSDAYIRNKPVDATTTKSGLMSAADKTKLNGIAAGAEVNVQADWNVTNTASDAYIKNKPVDATTAKSGLMSASDKTFLDGIRNMKIVGVYQFQSGGDFYASHGMTATCRAATASNGEACFRVTLLGGAANKLYYPFAVAPLGYTVAVNNRAAGQAYIDVVFRNNSNGYTERPNSGMLFLIEIN